MPFTENNVDSVVYMTAPDIATTHAFTTRYGGASNGIFDSLNLGMRLGDDPDNVTENYNRICHALGITINAIVCSNQVHGTGIRVVTREDRGRLFLPNPHQSDGLITNVSDVSLLIFTADCTPILLYDPVRRAAGAVHAGWRGTVADIAGAAVKKMTDIFGCKPADIRAAIGPCISKCCYETGRDVADAINDTLGSDADECFGRLGGTTMVDLKTANRILLQNAGVRDISVSSECTSCRSDKYWSHRKTNGRRGSQSAIIAIGSQ